MLHAYFTLTKGAWCEHGTPRAEWGGGLSGWLGWVPNSTAPRVLPAGPFAVLYWH